MSGIDFTVILLCLIISAQALFPEDPAPCKYGDGKCIAKFINTLLSKRSGKEDPSLNLRRMDPMPVDRIIVKQDSNSVGIGVNFTNNLIYGAKDIRIVGVKGFGQDLTEQHALKIVAKKLSLVGPYSIKGKVLILPISGSGNSNITMTNIQGVLRIKGQTLEKNGETYLDVTDVRLTMKPQTISFLFSNLFNGDKVLGDNMNAFMNENSQLLYKEAGQAIGHGLSQVYFDLIKGVFAHRPYAQLFAEE